MIGQPLALRVSFLHFSLQGIYQIQDFGWAETWNLDFEQMFGSSGFSYTNRTIYT